MGKYQLHWLGKGLQFVNKTQAISQRIERVPQVNQGDKKYCTAINQSSMRVKQDKNLAMAWTDYKKA